jgi:hypothetical protein
MLDPIIDAVKAFFAWLASLPGRFAQWLRFPPRALPDGTVRRNRLGLWLTRVGTMLVAALVVLYIVPFLWATSGVSGWDIDYPSKVIGENKMVSAEQQVRPGGGSAEARSCARSQTVDMMRYLIGFSVDENTWVPAMPQYKLGFFGIAWESTPFFDNKASFQHGSLVAIRRVAVELTDQIGRVRGSSEADADLQAARGSLNYDDEIWYFNPFSERLPFGPVTPAPTIFRNSERAYERYNAKLESCQALFDARSDNLRQFLDRISNDLGSVTETLSRRSGAEVFDTRTKTFVPGTGNDYGWFDFQADNLFNYADGMMYAYHGLLQAARIDFADVIKQRSLGDVWDRMEAHIAESANLDPLIVSNGRKDGFLLPDHLAVMSEDMLRARANMDEIVDILDR